MFQAWVLALVCVLTSLTPLEAAKGSLRAGVLSRSELCKKEKWSRLYIVMITEAG